MHESVLLQETIDGLDLHAGDVLVDGTLGRGGHTIAALKKVPGITVIGLDRDQDAIDESKAKLTAAGFVEGKDFTLVLSNFRDMDKALATVGKTANKIMLDIGVSSPHLDSSGRGFSFRKDEPLLMTMEKEVSESAFTARDIVNGWKEEDIANVIYAYGEERYSRRIAAAIVEARETAPIETTFQLAEIIKGAVGKLYRLQKIDPSTRTFQALRIAVNDELGSLKQGLNVALATLAAGGRLAVISFHSLEDRIVKVAFKEAEKEGKGKQSTKKPIVPTEDEMRANPRSRSAKLRIFIKTV
jgi:16S rRNA (cytosine1402-N4)-methyltransferase